MIDKSLYRWRYCDGKDGKQFRVVDDVYRPKIITIIEVLVVAKIICVALNKLILFRFSDANDFVGTLLNSDINFISLRVALLQEGQFFAQLTIVII